MDQFSSFFDPPPPCGLTWTISWPPLKPCRLLGHPPTSSTTFLGKFFCTKMTSKKSKNSLGINKYNTALQKKFVWAQLFVLAKISKNMHEDTFLKENFVHMDHVIDPPPACGPTWTIERPPSPFTCPRGLWMPPIYTFKKNQYYKNNLWI